MQKENISSELFLLYILKEKKGKKKLVKSVKDVCVFCLYQKTCSSSGRFFLLSSCSTLALHRFPPQSPWPMPVIAATSSKFFAPDSRASSSRISFIPWQMQPGLRRAIILSSGCIRMVVELVIDAKRQFGANTRDTGKIIGTGCFNFFVAAKCFKHKFFTFITDPFYIVNGGV